MRLSEQAKGAKKSPKDDKTIVSRFCTLTVVIYRTTLKFGDSHTKARRKNSKAANFYGVPWFFYGVPSSKTAMQCRTSRSFD